MKIVLLGYMASGKSSIGRRLSEKMNIPLLDLDDYISEKENLSVSEIFQQKGEVYFRKIEHEYVKEVLNTNTTFILALGGGTPCYGDNMKFINSTDAMSIYLEGSTKNMIDRLIRKKTKRPLVASLSDEQIPEFVAKHLFERRHFYEQAKTIIKIDNKKKKDVAEEIYKLIKLN